MQDPLRATLQIAAGGAAGRRELSAATDQCFDDRGDDIARQGAHGVLQPVP